MRTKTFFLQPNILCQCLLFYSSSRSEHTETGNKAKTNTTISIFMCMKVSINIKLCAANLEIRYFLMPYLLLIVTSM